MNQASSSNTLLSAKQGFFEIPVSENGSLSGRFLLWCNKQEENKFLWLVIALLGNIGMVLPFTLLAILFASGNNFTLWILACVANVPVLAINLAAQPTKFTLPALFFASLINGLIIIYCLAVLLMPF